MFASLRRGERGLISIECFIFIDCPNPGLERTESQPHRELSLERDSWRMLDGVHKLFAGRERTQEAQTQMCKWFIKEEDGGGVRNLEPNTPTLPWLVFVSLTLGICYNLWLVPFSIRYSFHSAFSSAHQEELAAGSRQFLASILLSLPRATQLPRFHCRWGSRKQKMGTVVKEQPPFL